MQLMREEGLNPYSNDTQRTISNNDFLQKYAHLTAQDSTHTDSQSIESAPRESIVGRVRFIRLMGKACFIKIQDESGILQAYVSKNDIGEDFAYIKKILEVGDIINVSGYAFVTKTGELSIHALSFKILK